jgi:hypothetical protein
MLGPVGTLNLHTTIRAEATLYAARVISDHVSRSGIGGFVALVRYRCSMTITPTEPQAPVPPVVRRYEVWIAAMFVCITVVAVAAPFVLWRLVPRVSPLWALPGIPLVIVTTTFGTIWYTRRHKARIKRAVLAASGRACVACVYDLGGMSDTGDCPECGRRFDIAADRRSWKQAGMYE